MARRRIGEILLEENIISVGLLNQAVLKQKKSSKPLGQILQEIAKISEKDIAKALSIQFKLPYLRKFSHCDISHDTLTKVDVGSALANLVFPLKEEENILYLAMANPLDMDVQNELAFQFGKRVSPFVSTPDEIKTAIMTHMVKQQEKYSEKQKSVVLHVDSQLAALKTMGRILERDGFSVQQGQTGTEGLKLAVQVQPDVILTDIELPLLDGKEMFMSLRENQSTAAIPVIALSSKNSAEIEYQLLEMGFYDYVAKPLDAMRLLARIRRAVRHSRSAA